MLEHSQVPTRAAGHHPCIVRTGGNPLQRGLITDFGRNGARLVIRGASLLPDQFEIMCMGLGLNTTATVQWRGADAVGLSWD